MKKMLIVLTALIGFGFAANATVQSDVIANLSYNVVLQTYQDLAKNAVTLNKDVDALIANPTQKNLETAQNAWRLTRASYETSEGFLFGPIDALSVDPMIDTWPLGLGDLRAILASNQTLNLDFVRSLNSNVQGFHAIEFLLFGEGITTNTKDVTTFTPRELQYLSAVSALLVEQTDLLMNAWTTHFDPTDLSTPAYIDVISRPGANNQYYSSETAVIAEFAGGMIDILNEASTAKLPDATGSDIENANASLEESPFSWNSINDYTSNINSVLNIYTGSYAGHTGPGIKDLVAVRDAQLANQVEAQILNCRVLIQDIKGPNNISFGQAIKTNDGRTRIFAAIKALTVLQSTLQNQVLPLLN